MAGLAEYFNRERYSPKYEIGDRVIGKYEKIPFVGSVGNDRYICDERGPEVTIHLDLPLLINNVIHRIIVVKHKSIERLLQYDEDFRLSGKPHKSRK